VHAVTYRTVVALDGDDVLDKGMQGYRALETGTSVVIALTGRVLSAVLTSPTAIDSALHCRPSPSTHGGSSAAMWHQLSAGNPYHITSAKERLCPDLAAAKHTLITIPCSVLP
jgi:hypothetical protein